MFIIQKCLSNVKSILDSRQVIRKKTKLRGSCKTNEEKNTTIDADWVFSAKFTEKEKNSGKPGALVLK
jgi:hypothetical protein